MNNLHLQAILFFLISSFSYAKNTSSFMKGVDIYENTKNPLPLYEAKRREFVFLLLAQENIG